MMLGSTYVLFVVYIRTSHLKNTDLFFSRIHNPVQIQSYEESNWRSSVLRKYFRVKKEVSDEIQTSISFIKYELQTSIENNVSCKKKSFWLNGDGLKKMLTMNPMEKTDHKNEHNIR